MTDLCSAVRPTQYGQEGRRRNCYEHLVDIPEAGERHLFLTDTGCGYSLYHVRFHSNIPKFARKELKSIQLVISWQPDTCKVYGKTTITLMIQKKLYEHDFIIVEDTVIPILGRDFMRKFDQHHRISEGRIYIVDQEVPSYTNAGLRESEGKQHVPLPRSSAEHRGCYTC